MSLNSSFGSPEGTYSERVFGKPQNRVQKTVDGTKGVLISWIEGIVDFSHHQYKTFLLATLLASCPLNTHAEESISLGVWYTSSEEISEEEQDDFKKLLHLYVEGIPAREMKQSLEEDAFIYYRDVLFFDSNAKGYVKSVITNARITQQIDLGAKDIPSITDLVLWSDSWDAELWEEFLHKALANYPEQEDKMLRVFRSTWLVPEGFERS